VAWFAGLGLAKTTSVARFFFLRVVFGRGGGGLGSSPAHGVGGGRPHRNDGATPRAVRREDADETLERVARRGNQDRNAREEFRGVRSVRERVSNSVSVNGYSGGRRPD